jgi:uncharacterized membrane protein YeiH
MGARFAMFDGGHISRTTRFHRDRKLPMRMVSRTDYLIIVLMLEPAISIVVVVLLFLLGNTIHGLLEDRLGLWIFLIDGCLAATALYCLVRFIRWAWETPMPFISL